MISEITILRNKDQHYVVKRSILKKSDLRNIKCRTNLKQK